MKISWNFNHSSEVSLVGRSIGLSWCYDTIYNEGESMTVMLLDCDTSHYILEDEIDSRTL